jgi:methyl-accepting chemotaxis protein
MTQAARETGAASGNLLKAAAELSQQAERLSVEVAAFLAKARAA